MSPGSNGAKTNCVVEDQLLYQPLLYQCLKAMSCGFIVCAQSQQGWVYLTSRRAMQGGAAVWFPFAPHSGDVMFCGTSSPGHLWLRHDLATTSSPAKANKKYANSFLLNIASAGGALQQQCWFTERSALTPAVASTRCFSNKCRKLNKTIDILPYGLRKCSDMNIKQLNFI